jgi:hypothetical protein
MKKENDRENHKSSATNPRGLRAAEDKLKMENERALIRKTLLKTQ